jgi:hypothetical protein
MTSHLDVSDRHYFGRNSVDLVKRFGADTTLRDLFDYNAEMDLYHVWSKPCAAGLNMSTWLDNLLHGMDLLVIRRKLADGLDGTHWTIRRHTPATIAVDCKEVLPPPHQAPADDRGAGAF